MLVVPQTDTGMLMTLGASFASFNRAAHPGVPAEHDHRTPLTPRVILSDGEFFCQAMLATQLNHLVEDQSVDKHVVVRLSQFVANSVQGRRLIIILGLEVQPYSGDRIGHPVNVESAEANGGVKPGVKQETAAAAPAAARGAAPSRAPPARTGGAAQGPIFPIEALSPYSNKYVQLS